MLKKFRAWTGYKYYYDVIVFDDNHILELRDSDTNQYSCEKVVCIEQSTGLKDKNDKEIYEGDIIKQDMHWRPSRKWTPYMIWRVASDEDVSAFELIRLSGRKYMSGGYLCSVEKEDYEVIGNIHENKELLGNEK